MQKEECSIKIADFVIKIIFYPSNDKNSSRKFRFWSKKLIIDFGTNKSSSDFILEIRDRLSLQSNKYFLLSDKKNRIITFYQITFEQFNFLIQNILYLLISNHYGFFIHASSSKIDGKAYLFLGKSGSGKSTIVKNLTPKYQALSDDLSIIRKIKGKYYFFQHPLWEKNTIESRSSNRSPIGKFFFLKKSVKPSIKKIADKEVIFKKLVMQLKGHDKKNVKTLMGFISKIDNFYILFASINPEEMKELF